jgi:hypothetical protein
MMVFRFDFEKHNEEIAKLVSEKVTETLAKNIETYAQSGLVPGHEISIATIVTAIQLSGTYTVQMLQKYHKELNEYLSQEQK